MNRGLAPLRPQPAFWKTWAGPALDWRPAPGLDTAGRVRKLMAVNTLLWHVAHTRPRREKKLLEHCQREGIAAQLPCHRAVHRYRGKTVAFDKPLFPGYVFLQMPKERRNTVAQSDHVANLLEVFDQELFARQFADIQRALETDLEIRLAPTIGEGMRVKVKHGPLRGVEGWVEKRHGMATVLIRLDFIGQAAAVKLDATDLELV